MVLQGNDHTTKSPEPIETFWPARCFFRVLRPPVLFRFEIDAYQITDELGNYIVREIGDGTTHAIIIPRIRMSPIIIYNL